jgi:hypothetical protein
VLPPGSRERSPQVVRRQPLPATVIGLRAQLKVRGPSNETVRFIKSGVAEPPLWGWGLELTFQELRWY